jgi:hypothetical protein
MRPLLKSHSEGLPAVRRSPQEPRRCRDAVPRLDPRGPLLWPRRFYREGLGGNSLAAYNLTIEHNYFKRDPLGGPFAAMRFIDCATCTDGTTAERGESNDV